MHYISNWQCCSKLFSSCSCFRLVFYIYASCNFPAYNTGSLAERLWFSTLFTFGYFHPVFPQLPSDPGIVPIDSTLWASAKPEIPLTVGITLAMELCLFPYISATCSTFTACKDTQDAICWLLSSSLKKPDPPQFWGSFCYS